MYNTIKKVAKKCCDIICFTINSASYLRKTKTIGKKSIKKILIINLQGIGDIVMTTPLISAIKEQWPNAQLDYLCYKNNAELLENDPRIHQIFKRRKEGIFNNEYIETLQNIRKEKYDLIINAFPAQHSALLTVLSNAKYKIGNLYSTQSTSNNLNIPKMPKTWDIRRNAKHIAMQLGLKEYDETQLILKQKKEKNVEEYFKKNKLRSCIAINPFATWKAKNWPEERWIACMQAIRNTWKGHILIIGGPNDVAQSKYFEEVLGNAILNCTGKWNIKETAAVLKKCNVCITTDSGLLHIAIAMQTPTVALFAVTNPEILVAGAKNIVVCSSYPDCPKKYRFNHNNEPRDYAQECMKKITVEQVIKAIERVQ